jgi:hypothetical protein
LSRRRPSAAFGVSKETFSPWNGLPSLRLRWAGRGSRQPSLATEPVIE